MKRLRVVRVQRDQAPCDVHPYTIRLGRQSRGMSLSHLARALDMPSRDLQWIEHGKLLFPADRLEALCEALDYPPAFFAHSFGETARRIHDAQARMFTCDTHSWVDEAIEQAMEEASEIGRLKQRVRELERQVAEKAR